LTSIRRITPPWTTARGSTPLNDLREVAKEGSKVPPMGSRLAWFVHCSTAESQKCGNNNEPSDRRAAELILAELLKRVNPGWSKVCSPLGSDVKRMSRLLPRPSLIRYLMPVSHDDHLLSVGESRPACLHLPQPSPNAKTVV